MRRLRLERDAMLGRLQALRLVRAEEQAKCNSFVRVMTEHLDSEQAGVRAAEQKLMKVGFSTSSSS